MADIVNTEQAVAGNREGSGHPAAAPRIQAKKKKKLKRIITALILLAVALGIAAGLYSLFRKQPEDEKQMMTEFTYRGSLQSMVQGSGITKPKDSATVSALVKGKVLELYVQSGDRVEAGKQLFSIDTSEIDASIEDADADLSKQRKALDDLYKSIDGLTITAPFSGKLVGVRIEKGELIPAGTQIATLVNDSKLRVKQYFSYAYENDIYAGMPVSVSVPSSMSNLAGSVEKVVKVKRVSPEGSVLFEVTAVLDNPGTLTEGVGATFYITSGSGEEIYPYEPGELEYYEKRAITAKTSGTAVTVNAGDYYSVSAGDVLAVLESDVFGEQVKNAEAMVEAAQKKVDGLQETLKSYNATAPISGTVTSCSFVKGSEVQVGTTSITIADSSTMLVEAQIDERNIAFVKEGMTANIIQYGMDKQTNYMGTITSVSMEGKFENGYSYFPAVITVVNDGTLLSGMYVSYDMVASQADDCIIAPIQAVKYTEQGTCLFIKSETPPENALDLGEGIVPEGFYAVLVEVGLSDDTGAQIISGVEEGVEVYTQQMVNSGSSFNGGTIMYKG